MAVSNATSLSDVGLRSFDPRWPTRGIDPGRAWVDYSPLADEVMVYFDRPVPAVSVPIDTPERDYVYLRVDEETEAVVGIQVETFLAWVAEFHPRWAPLADPAASAEERGDAVAAFVADAAGLFALHGAGGA